MASQKPEDNNDIAEPDSRTKVLTISAIGSLILLMVIVFISNQVVYAISVDGELVGNIKDKATLEEVRQEIEKLQTQQLGAEVEFIQAIEVEEVKAWGKEVCSQEEIRDCLKRLLSVRVKAVAIKVDGRQIAVAKNEEEALAALQGVKDYYIEKTPGELREVEVEEKVTLSQRYVDPSTIMTQEDIKELVLKGTQEFRTYKVQKGDNLWTIAQEEGITVEELQEANPQLKGENRLAIDDELNLMEIKPLLTVAVVKHLTYEEDIKYNTKTERDSSMWKWDRKVKNPGELGKKEIVSEVSYENGIKVASKVLDEKVVKEPVDRVLVQGTKAEVAFRGSGRFSWPITGQITSSFGRRGGEYHTGIDICASSGTPVYASNSGVVTFAGWSGGYGNLIIVDHGGGITTHYAHCSSLLAKAGDKIEKGQAIARVGSTGRSTGPHLHFEIRISGTPQNPISYLGK